MLRFRCSVSLNANPNHQHTPECYVRSGKAKVKFLSLLLSSLVKYSWFAAFKLGDLANLPFSRLLKTYASFHITKRSFTKVTGKVCVCVCVCVGVWKRDVSRHHTDTCAMNACSPLVLTWMCMQWEDVELVFSPLCNCIMGWLCITDIDLAQGTDYSTKDNTEFLLLTTLIAIHMECA